MTRLGRLCLALFIANAFAIVVLWWAGLGASPPTGLPGLLNASGRLTEGLPGFEALAIDPDLQSASTSGSADLGARASAVASAE